MDKKDFDDFLSLAKVNSKLFRDIDRSIFTYAQNNVVDQLLNDFNSALQALFESLEKIDNYKGKIDSLLEEIERLNDENYFAADKANRLEGLLKSYKEKEDTVSILAIDLAAENLALRKKIDVDANAH